MALRQVKSMRTALSRKCGEKAAKQADSVHKAEAPLPNIGEAALDEAEDMDQTAAKAKVVGAKNEALTSAETALHTEEEEAAKLKNQSETDQAEAKKIEHSRGISDDVIKQAFAKASVSFGKVVDAKMRVEMANKAVQTLKQEALKNLGEENEEALTEKATREKERVAKEQEQSLVTESATLKEKVKEATASAEKASEEVQQDTSKETGKVHVLYPIQCKFVGSCCCAIAVLRVLGISILYVSHLLRCRSYLKRLDRMWTTRTKSKVLKKHVSTRSRQLKTKKQRSNRVTKRGSI